MAFSLIKNKQENVNIIGPEAIAVSVICLFFSHIIVPLVIFCFNICEM